MYFRSSQSKNQYDIPKKQKAKQISYKKQFTSNINQQVSQNTLARDKKITQIQLNNKMDQDYYIGSDVQYKSCASQSSQSNNANQQYKQQKEQQKKNLQEKDMMKQSLDQRFKKTLDIKIDTKLLMQIQKQLAQIEQDFKFRTDFMENQDRILKKRLEKQQLNYDYAKHLNVMTDKNEKNFQPHQRRAPFRNNLRKQIQQLRAMLKSKHGSACFSYNKFTSQQVMAVFQKSNIQQQNIIKLTSLYIAWTRVSMIIKFIQHKQFPKLKVLNIGGNFVQSIQLICQVRMPNLQDVYLWNNNLTQVRSLKRCNWPNLKVLDIHVNKIVDLKDLRFLGNDKIQSVIFDSNLLASFDESIIMCSHSPRSKISIMSNKVISFMGRPSMRRRKKAIEVQPCTIRVKYI